MICLSYRINPSQGPSRLGYPSQLCSGLVHHRRASEPDQYRIDSRLQHSHFSGDWSAHFILHSVHLLHHVEAPSGRRSASLSILSGSVWAPGQPFFSLVSPARFRNDILPDNTTSYAISYELEHPRVWSGRCIFHLLFSHSRKAKLRRASYVCKAKLRECTRIYMTERNLCCPL